MKSELPLFDEETWNQLPSFFENLPEPVLLKVWGDSSVNNDVGEAIRLVKTLSEEFTAIDFALLPPRASHFYYPVIGIMGRESTKLIDYGVRIIGLPVGNQMTSLVAAIQSVSFRGMTSEAQTRIKLHRLSEDVTLELITSAEDEVGPVMAQSIFNMAIFSPHIRSYMIMGDAFPEAIIRYSVNFVPHLVINGRVHVEGFVGEDALLNHISSALNARK